MGLNREVKTQESSSQEARRAQEVHSTRLCPGTVGLCTCHLPSGLHQRGELGCTTPNIGSWSLFFTINSSRRMGAILFFLKKNFSHLLLAPDLADEPRCVNQALEASWKGRGA